MDSILTLPTLPAIIDILRKKNKKIVLVGGCFDILHHGHISFLKESKALGDVLIVALEHDENVRRLKGKTRPFQKQSERAEILSSLRFVDFVLLLPPMSTNSEYKDLVASIHPSFVSMTEGDTHLQDKRTQGESVGATVHVISKIDTLSTSELAKKVGLE